MSLSKQIAKALKAGAISLSTNAQAWVNWAMTQDATGNLIDFTAGQALLGSTTPPAAVPSYLFALPNNVWPGWKHNNAEHANNLPPGPDRDAAFKNLDRANQIWNNEGRELSVAMACYPLLPDGSGLDIDHPIIGSTSWPARQLTAQPSGQLIDTSNDAGVLLLCSQTRMPGPSGPADPHGHVPGA